MKLTGAQMVCESLIREGVDTMFGIPGGAILPLYQTFHQYPQLKHILVRHEQGAAMAADGYYRVTGKVGVAMATSGPGATNLVTGLATAQMDSTAVVAITGQVSRGAIGKDAFQECDITGVTLPVTKHNYLVMDINDIPRVIKEAFYLAKSGRPGPVLVDIPKDLFTEEAEFIYPETVEIPGYNPTLEGNMSQIKKAASLINSAKKPVILSGHGAVLSRAFDEVKDLAERAQIPVITTLLGISSFPETHVLSLGMPGMHGVAYASMALDQADLIVSLGARFDDRVTGKLTSFAPNAKIIHIDIDPSVIGQNVRTQVPLVGDVKNVLQTLIPQVKQNNHEEWVQHIEEMRINHPSLRLKEKENLTQQYIIKKISDITQGGAVVVTGVGQHQMWTAQYYTFSQPNSWVTSGGLGTMGFEVPAAMGAQVGKPDSVVWSICGDGGFQMTLSDLATIVENKLPIKFAIMNNHFLGMVRQWQHLFYEDTFTATEYSGNPDFVKLAEAYGIHSFRVTEKSEVDNAITDAMKHDGPVLIDFMVDHEENVYPMIPPGESVQEIVEEPTEEPTWR
ncbi:MAG: biosynthetic-type acetolactate synthase large subunit [SAR202 cluster bacterium]|nr:biosynthetic-type acetolactate synthase large subunit [SAR202 cluster bacterium]|tara:strand:- start:584 stop:2278 length:1695 start_codon:yes stop_codon:yes gene_type:complete